MMKTPIHRLLPAALLMLAATACEDTLTAPGAPGTNGDGPTLTLCIDSNDEGTQTRTNLASAAPSHNVRSAKILIFKGEGDEATYYKTETTEWIVDETTGATTTDRITYTLQSAFVDNTTYTLLGVGMDAANEGEFNYDFKDKDGNELEVGVTTLANAYACLKEDKSPKDCEFFTGTVTFTQEGKNTQVDDLHLRRRVAGVMLYVTEIPQRLTKESTSYLVTEIKLELGRDQRKSVLLKRDTDAEQENPEGEEWTDSKTLLTIDAPVNNYDPTKELYTFDAQDGRKPNSLYTACYMLPLNKDDNNNATFTVNIYGHTDAESDGTIDDPDEEPILLKSFIVTNRSEKDATAFDIHSNYIYCIGKYNPTEGVDEPISLSGKPLEVEVQEWTEIKENNPDFGMAQVQALFDDNDNEIQNCMSHWHTIKLLPPAETMQRFVRSITITVDDVTDIPEDITGYDRLCNYHWLYLRGTTDKVDDDVDTKLADTYETSMVLYNGEQYGEEDCSITLPQVEVFMEDYARPRKEGYGWEPDGKGGYKASVLTENIINKIINDTRKKDLILSTVIEYNGVTTTRVDRITIEQYNTITVAYTEYDNKNTPYTAFCGFNREDLVNKEPDVTDAPYLFESGLNNSDFTNYALFPYTGSNKDYTGSIEDGAWNVQYIGLSLFSETEWEESIYYDAQYVCYEMNGPDGTGGYSINKEATNIRTTQNGGNEEGFTPGWYLPAELEIEGLMKLTVECSKLGDKYDEGTGANDYRNQVTNIKFRSATYWTSTTAGYAAADTYKSLTYKYEYDEDNDEYIFTQTPYSRRVDNYRCYIRQARHFAENMPDWSE